MSPLWAGLEKAPGPAQLLPAIMPSARAYLVRAAAWTFPAISSLYTHQAQLESWAVMAIGQLK